MYEMMTKAGVHFCLLMVPGLRFPNVTAGKYIWSAIE